MTRDDIEHMVREAGIKTGFVLHMTKWDKATWLFMRRFAVLVAAAEREACAKVCEEPGWNAAKWCADRIRARGQG
jgi:hypothetical protein